MKGVCPGCGLSADLIAFSAEVAARGAIAAALKLPNQLGHRMLLYLQLFAPAERSITLAKTERLFSELLQCVGEARVTRKGRTWAAPLPLWEQGIDEMLAKRHILTLPLKSHGYLYEIVVGLASQAEGRAEQQREQTRAYGMSAERTGAGAPQAIGEVLERSRMPESVRDALRRKDQPS